MAVKWLQSAHYPPAAPRLQPGRTRQENDADYERLQAALKVPRYVEEMYGRAEAGRKRKG